MFGIGFMELFIIAVAVLIFVGPQKLPEVMRQGGKLFVQLRRTANDVRGTFDQVVRDAEEELRREEQAALKELLAAKAAATETITTTATQLTDAANSAPHPDAPIGSSAMSGDPHAPLTAAVPHPAEPQAATHSQPATQPAPAPHPAGPGSIAGEQSPGAPK